ncbi:MAG: ABC transporter permease [Alphaproteobacteria bacterium]|nr:ABC transporter permease [Alphaproteobacteria bacterium]
MLILRLAWRNLLRNTRRTGVTVAAMTFGLWVMVLYSGLVAGYIHGMERNILEIEMGDVQVFAEGYQDDPSIYTRIEDPDAVLSALDEAGLSSSARLMGGGLAAAGDQSAGVSLRGVNVARDATVSRIHERVGQGAWLDPADPTGVVIGWRLAKALVIGPGDELIVLTQGADGSIANALYTVRGVLVTIGDGVDRAGVFMNEDALRELLVLPGGAHQIVVRKPDTMDLDAAVVATKAAAPGLQVMSWRELMPVLATMLDSSRSLIVFVFFIVYIAIGILILNAMLMAVFERVREFGVMKALGMSPRTVLTLILAESVLQVLVAMVLGLTLSLPAAWYLTNVGVNVGELGGMSVMGMAMPPIWTGLFDAETFAGPVVAMLIIVSAAVIYPAVKAAVIRPVEAMRHR